MLDRAVKYMLGYRPEDSDLDIVEEWTLKQAMYGKPCNDLAYCPYGEEVLDQPLLAAALQSAFTVEELRSIAIDAAQGRWAKVHEDWTCAFVEGRLEQIESSSQDEEVPACIADACCNVSGRLCPSFAYAQVGRDQEQPVSHGFEIATCDCCGEKFLATTCQGRGAIQL